MTPELADVFFRGVEGVYGPQSASGDDASPQNRSVLRAMHTPTAPKIIRLLGGLSPIHLTRRRGAKGLVWGARGPFPPAAAMVGSGCEGSWRRTSDRPTVGIVTIVYGSIIFYSYVVPIHS